MSLLRVRTFPDPILKVKAEPLTEFGPKEQKLFDDMIETMYVEDGVGLAAPQVGVSKRIMIVSPKSKRGDEQVIVDPEILEASGREMGMEGCLSLPGLSGEVPRAKKIKLRYQDRLGNSHTVDLKDFFARVIQHEMDHLEGILLIDRVDFNQRQELLSQYRTL